LIKSEVEPDKLSFEESRQKLKTLFQGQVRQPAGNTTATVNKDQLVGESRPPLETKNDEQAVGSDTKDPSNAKALPRYEETMNRPDKLEAGSEALMPSSEEQENTEEEKEAIRARLLPPGTKLLASLFAHSTGGEQQKKVSTQALERAVKDEAVDTPQLPRSLSNETGPTGSVATAETAVEDKQITTSLETPIGSPASMIDEIKELALARQEERERKAAMAA
jgi:hypothetical protein